MVLSADWLVRIRCEWTSWKERNVSHALSSDCVKLNLPTALNFAGITVDAAFMEYLGKTLDPSEYNGDFTWLTQKLVRLFSKQKHKAGSSDSMPRWIQPVIGLKPRGAREDYLVVDRYVSFYTLYQIRCIPI